MRLRSASLVVLIPGSALAAALLAPGCGPEASGVEACRRIEGARCEAAVSCGLSEEDAADCKLIYQDQCLHGIENAAHKPTELEADACVAAVEATSACAAAGVKNMSACPGATLVSGALDRAPCDVILSAAHELAACAFAAGEPDAGVPVVDAGDAGDAGDAASD